MEGLEKPWGTLAENLLRVQVLIWLNTAGIVSSFVCLFVCSWPCSPVGYGDVFLLPDGHDLPGAEA